MSGWKTYLRILLPYFYLMFINVGLINTQAAFVCFLHTHTQVQNIMYQDFNRGLNKTIFKLKYIYIYKRIIMCKKIVRP